MIMTVISEGQKGQREAEIEAGGCPERRNRAGGREAGTWMQPLCSRLACGGLPGAVPAAWAGWRGVCRAGPHWGGVTVTPQAAGPGVMSSLGGRQGCMGVVVRSGWAGVS